MRSHQKQQVISGKGLHNEEEVEKLFNNYEAKLSGQMVKLLGRSIINMYSVGACSALGITNQDALGVGIITSRHYLLSEHKGPAGPTPTAHKNGERTSGISGTSETRDNKNGGDEKTTE